MARKARNQVDGRAARRRSMEYRQTAHPRNAVVIHSGMNKTCGVIAIASDAIVHGRLDNNEPSVPRGLAIVTLQTEQRQRLEAAMAMGLAM